MKNFENDIKAVKSNINTNLIDLPNYQIKDAGENSDLKIKEFNLNGNKEELISSIEDKNRNTSTSNKLYFIFGKKQLIELLFFVF